MFKFKKILGRKDVILNQRIDATISNDFLSQINQIIQDSINYMPI
jgi:hypothetical protein